MKPILKATVACSLLMASTLSLANPQATPKKDEFADLRVSKDNMSKEQAKEIEAGAVPVAVYYGGVAAMAGVRAVSKKFIQKQIKKQTDFPRSDNGYRSPRFSGSNCCYGSHTGSTMSGSTH